jgi:hypothetical protein
VTEQIFILEFWISLERVGLVVILRRHDECRLRYCIMFECSRPSHDSVKISSGAGFAQPQLS